ncbi:fibronectin type III domain-containing protein [Nocardioides speluncae]|uniref:fibronectin type III domain-containing protein n=1 Tax=Nocardioides speluncae TaxID=2670337 RepID=UPI0012B1813A|nr:fibronectin type III domain-containing protein [Nocardioides speluncae]
MARRVLVWVAVVVGLVAWLTPTVTPAQAADPVRIMVVGDSITHGSSGDWTWRYRLARHLTATGAEVDFVGGHSGLYDLNSKGFGSMAYLDAGFDTHHQARWGRTLLEETTTIRSEVATHAADVVLLLMGSNDVGLSGIDGEESEYRLRTFVANARAARAGVDVVIGKINVPTNVDSDAARAAFAGFNAAVDRVASDLSTPESQLVVADTTAGYDPASDNFDTVHPNARGEYKIARAFGDALHDSYGLGGTFPAIPAVPIGPQQAPQAQVAASDSTLHVYWTESLGATGYVVRARDVTAGEVDFTVRARVAGRNARFPAVNGHRYDVQVQAAKWFAEGASSAVVAATPAAGALPPAAPAQPTGVTVSNRSGEVGLSWTAVPQATHYYVEYREAGSGAAFARWPVTSKTSAATIRGLVNGARYDVRVQAYQGHGEGPFSGTLTAAPTGPTPAAPTVTATPGDERATLSWPAVTHATGYYVWMRGPGETVFTKLALPVFGTRWIPGLTPGATYDFMVQAYNGLIAGGRSTPVSVTPSGIAPAAPVLTVTALPQGARLTWTTPEHANNYRVYLRHVTAGQSSWSVTTLPVWGPPWEASGLVAGHTYEFKVQALNGQVEGGTSAVVAATIEGA